MAQTHITNITGRIRVQATPPVYGTSESDPISGDEFWNSTTKGWYIYSGNNWLGRNWSTTSTSSSTSTSTSSSTSTTSTSSSTSSSTSTSTSTTTTI